MAKTYTRPGLSRPARLGERLAPVLKWIGSCQLGLWLVMQPLRPILVVGDSMAPSLLPGQVVVGRPPEGPVNVGDVVVFEWSGQELIKRVAAVSGEPVDSGIGDRKVKVPNRSLWVLGDNPPRSFDSRDFGPVREREVDYVVVFPSTRL
jgi:signal peptidase I